MWRGFLKLSWQLPLLLLYITSNLLVVSHDAHEVTTTTRELSYMALEGRYVLDGKTEYVYQSGTPKAKGLLFLAHGCSHSATDWWPQSPSCKRCIGLPIERTIVASGLAEGYLVVAMSSEDRESKCWHPSVDAEKGLQVIKHLRAEHAIPLSAPNFVLGASSGGAFAGYFGIFLNKAAKSDNDPSLSCPAICIQVSTLIPRFIRDDRSMSYLPRHTTIVGMERDSHTASAITEAVAKVEAYNAQRKSRDNGQERKSAVFLVAKPRPLDPNYFARVGSHLTPEESALLVAGLENGGYLDPKTKLLLEDPRRTADGLATIARSSVPNLVAKDSLVPDRSGIIELLNVAYAMHEITDEKLDEVFASFRESTARHKVE
jgi:hypothetical protein